MKENQVHSPKEIARSRGIRRPSSKCMSPPRSRREPVKGQRKQRQRRKRRRRAFTFVPRKLEPPSELKVARSHGSSSFHRTPPASSGHFAPGPVSKPRFSAVTTVNGPSFRSLTLFPVRPRVGQSEKRPRNAMEKDDFEMITGLTRGSFFNRRVCAYSCDFRLDGTGIMRVWNIVGRREIDSRAEGQENSVF